MDLLAGNQNVLDAIRTRLDQHLKFCDTLERIRWQFTTTFGAGAITAIVFAVNDKSSEKQRYVALLLVFAFSLAGLVAQLRIFALIVVLWKRMLVL